MRGRRYSTVGESEKSLCVTQAVSQMEHTEERTQIWDVVQAELTPVQFTAVWLFYVEELSVRQIATVIGKSESAVKTLLCRARKLLIHRLRNHAEHHGVIFAENNSVSSKTT